jgi:hypothetical protein
LKSCGVYSMSYDLLSIFKLLICAVIASLSCSLGISCSHWVYLTHHVCVCVKLVYNTYSIHILNNIKNLYTIFLTINVNYIKWIGKKYKWYYTYNLKLSIRGNKPKLKNNGQKIRNKSIKWWQYLRSILLKHDIFNF